MADQKRKKKSTNNRFKSRLIAIVCLPKVTVYVPRGSVRGNLTKQGRTAKVSFRRNMDMDEVKSSVISAFSSIELSDYLYLRCGKDNRLKVLKDKDLSGDDVFELAGQGSLYITSVSSMHICMF